MSATRVDDDFDVIVIGAGYGGVTAAALSANDGKRVAQVGTGKPKARTPLPGLYLVGCDAGGRGSGTHQAVDSGFNVAAEVTADLA